MTTNTRELVLTAAASVFGRAVGSTDNFFALGGDSLLAAELAVALEERLSLDVDPELIMRSANLASLAAALTPANVPETEDTHE